MKKWCLFAGLAAMGWNCLAANLEALNEVLKLKHAGMDQDTILSFVKSKNLNYDLNADDLLALQKEGLNSAVISAMLASGKVASVPAPVSSQPIPVQTAPSQPVTPAVTAPPVSADAAYFYQELSPYGRWILTEDGQWCWQPSVAVSSRDWRPYWDKGHWVFTDNGWYWTSEYSWGWAPFHYGRWQLHPHHGWIWHPDRVWGPAWVVWREGGEYCGWAPIPPGATFDVSLGAFLWRGRRVEAGFDFGLDWNHFRFSLVRDLGDQPRLRLHSPEERRAMFGRTVIVNNYTVVKVAGLDHPRVVNHGIPVDRVRGVRGKPIEVVHVEDMHAPGPRRAHEEWDRDHKRVEVYRPRWEGHR